MKTILSALCLGAALLPLVSAEVRYVDASATGAADGVSWADAFPDLQAALAAAQPGDELWVAAGVYTPSASDATASFVLRDGVALYGGFAGHETFREQRDWDAHVTSLSGDVAGDDVIGSGLYWYSSWNTNTPNCGHVVRAENVGPATVLDGFLIEKGATGPAGTPAGHELMYGSGLYCVSASPTVRHCTFLHNEAAFASGGAMYLSDSSPLVQDCRFLENYTHLGHGGGLFTTGTSVPTIVGCEFARNVVVAGSGDVQGAGLCHYGDLPIEVVDCRFEDNLAKHFYPVSTYRAYGGGLASFLSGITVRDSVFLRNKAQLGGGLITWGPSLVENCLFAGNEAIPKPQDPYPEAGGEGAGLMIYAFQPHDMRVVGCTVAYNKGKKHVGVVSGWNATASIENTIVWGNVATHPEVQGGWEVEVGGNFDAAWSCIGKIFDPPVPGEDPIEPEKLPGCIASDPLFVVPGAAGDLRLGSGSPCVDAGRDDFVSATAVLDLGGGGRFQDDPSVADTGVGATPVVDMGAYERGASALTVDVASLSIAGGGVQRLSIDAGVARAGGIYLVAGTASGTAPGFDLGAVHVPLNFDAYSLASLGMANQGPFAGTLGVLDANGRATAAIVLPAAAVNPAQAGLQLDHAALVLVTTTPTFATGTAPLILAP